MKKEKKLGKILVVTAGDQSRGWIPPKRLLDEVKARILPLAKKAGYDDVLVIPYFCKVNGPLYN